MWPILILLILGVIVGFFFSGIKNFNKISEKISSYAIFILLFVMGLSVGANKEIMNNFADLGIKALIISLFAVGGSVFIAWLTWIFIFKNEK